MTTFCDADTIVMGDVMTFAEKLKQTRKKQGISQAELARRIGISRAAISRYESGERTQVAAPIIIAIAEVLGVDVADLVLDYTNIQVYETQEEATQAATVTDALQRIEKALALLNDDGIQVATERISELTEISRYQKNHI